MTITLWGSGTSRTMRAHWALAELGVAYEKKPIGPRTGETQEAAFRALNPKEKSPVLVEHDTTASQSNRSDEGLVLTESAAIVTYLGDKFGGLTPRVGTLERARYYEWMSYILMELDAHTLYVMRKHGDLKHLYGEAPSALSAARAGFDKQIRWALPRMESEPFLMGDAFSGVDILMTTCLDWAVAYGLQLAEPALAYRARHRQRPAFQAALAANAAPSKTTGSRLDR